MKRLFTFVVFTLWGAYGISQQFSAGPDTIICTGESTTLQGTGPPQYTYEWTSVPYDPTLSNPTSLTPTVQPVVTTDYTLEGRSVSFSNLVVNGNFEEGNTGFTSSYNYSPGPNGLWNEGTYAITDDASYNHNNFTCNNNHTPNGAYFMAINGAQQANVVIWTETIVGITPNTEYEFSTYVASLSASNPALLQFKINGVLLGQPFQASPIICEWYKFFEKWDSGTATSATISIVNQNTVGNGNDFSLDDINFSKVTYFEDECTVTVAPYPTSTFDMTTQTCTNDTVYVTYTGTASPAAQFNWDFGSAIVTGGPVPNPYKAIWPNSGVHTVTLHVDEVCPSDTTSHDIIVDQSPSSTLTADATNIPFGTSTTLHAIMNGNPGPLNFEWRPVDSLLNAAILDPETKLLGGTTLFIFDITDQSSGCTSADSITIQITGGALDILSITATPDSVCPGQTSTLLVDITGGSGNYEITWTSDPPGLVYTGPELSIDVSPNANTTYYADVFDGFTTVSTSIEIILLPSTTITSQPQDLVLLEGDTAEFTVSADLANSFLWQVSEDDGNTWVDLTNGNEYSGVNSYSLLIEPVNTSMHGNLYRCIVSGRCNNIPSGEAILKVYYFLDFESSLEQTEVCTYDTFSVACNVSNFTQIVDLNLSIEFDTIVLEYLGLSNVNPEFLNNLQEQSSGNSISINWNSSQDLTLPDETLFNFSFVALESSTSEIRWNNNICNITNLPGFHPTMDLTDSDITINPLPIPPYYALVDNDTINIADVVNITLSVKGGTGDALIWSSISCDGDTIGLSTPLEILRPEQTTTYYAYWINQCGSSLCSDVQVVIIYDFNIGIPNAFTPNGDGLNDEFRIVSNIILDEFLMQIFNRWGQLVYETSDQHKGWDGTYNGNKLKTGSYVWKISYKFEHGGSYNNNAVKTGTVTIID